MFRDWLQSLSGPDVKAASYEALMAELDSRIRVGGVRFTRDEMNER